MTVCSKLDFNFENTILLQKQQQAATKADKIRPIFPGSDKFGDPYWLWHYMTRRMFMSEWILDRNEKSHAEILKGINELREDLDKVEGRIIAKLDVVGLFKVAPAFCKQSLQLALPTSHNRHLPFIPKRSQEEADRRLKTRGYPRGCVGEPMATVVHELSRPTSASAHSGDNNNNTNPETLFVEDHSAQDETNRNETCRAGFFVVDKSSVNEITGRPKRRFITDAREANAKLMNFAEMKLFTLEALMTRMSTCMASSRCYALSADLRHWFHQIPLPSHLRKYFTITYKIMGEKTTRTIYPRAWPMGVHSAPGIGQAATWAMLLADLDTRGKRNVSEQEIARAQKLRAELGIDENQSFDEYVPWLPLRKGGGIFVLIDNIFIITPEKDVAARWRSRIVDQTNRFGATLKRHDGDDMRRHNTLDDIEAVELTKSSTTTIKFSGIELGGRGRRVAKEIKDHDQQLNNLSTTSWKLSYRELASVLGQTLWALRVHGFQMIHIQDYISLYRKAHPRIDEQESWDSETNIEGEDFEILKRYYTIARKNNFTPFPSTSVATRTVFLATDAAKDTMGFVYKIVENKDGIFRTSTGNINSEDGSVEISEWKSARSDQIPKHGHDAIWKGELEAVLRALEWINHEHGNICTTFLLAIDNTVAQHTLYRGYSVDHDAMLILEAIHRLTELHGSKLVIDYIKSAENPADELSREKNLILQKALNMEKHFNSFCTEAKRELLICGKHRILAGPLSVRRQRL